MILIIVFSLVMVEIDLNNPTHAYGIPTVIISLTPNNNRFNFTPTQSLCKNALPCDVTPAKFRRTSIWIKKYARF